MNQKVHIIETSSALEKTIPLLYNCKVLGTDVETEGLNPILSKLRTIQLASENDVLVIDSKKIGYEPTAHFLKPLLEDNEIVNIFHNAKFDCKFLKHYLNTDVQRVFDSYLGSVILQGGIRMAPGYHGLAEVADRHAGITVVKDEQRSDWSGELSTSQLQYAAKDATVLLPVREGMIEALKKSGLIRCAKLEFEAVAAFVWLELSGFYLDIDQWKRVAEQNVADSHKIAEEICAELKDVIEQGSLFGNTAINLNSPQQVQKYFRLFGVPMPDSTKEDFLLPLVHDYPILGKLLDYRGKAKAGSSFGEAWTEFVNQVTGRVHADFKQIGAEDTGRVSCSQPNLQQIPKEDLFRNCFKAEEGNILVSGDYSQIELRILADLAKDRQAMEAFASGVDFHTATAERINRSRDLAKNCNFAIPYGATENRVAATARIDILEARELMESYFEAFPGFKKWIKKQQRDVLITKSARTVSGRLMRYIFDSENWGQKSQAQRNATNGPIQGSSADILKRALRLFYEANKDRQNVVKLANIVHDEINVECPESMKEEVSYVLDQCMVAAAKEYLHEVEVKVDIKTQKEWKK